MKECPYCGNEYSDDTTMCPIDRQPINESGAIAATLEPAQDVAPENSPSSRKSETFAVYPEYRWSARDAWKCLGMILVLHILWYFVIGSLEYRFRHFYL